MMTASLISEDFPTLSGRQSPHHLSVFDGDTSMGDRVVELKRRLGAPSMPWQRDAQLAICSTDELGNWTHPTCCLLCTRQNGKSEILIDRCLFGLFKLNETIIYTAQRWKTARDAWRRTMSLIRSRSWLRKHVVKATCSQGEGIIELVSGAMISFGTRSNDSGRGLTDVDLVIYDEAYNLTEGEISAMAFVQMAARNPQRIYASSAVNQDQHPNGHVLAAVRARGLAREPRLYFAEWMAPCDVECCEMCALAGVMDREDEATWRYANPSYGVIQTAEKILDIKANLSTDAGRKAFDVEALGRGDWPDDAGAHEPIIKGWADMTDRTPRLTGPICIGLELSPDRRRWALAAAQHTTDDTTHVELGIFRSVTHDELVALLTRVVEVWDPVAVVIDGRSPAAVIEPKLIAAGIEPEKASTPQIAAWSGGFLDDATAGLLSHTNQPGLTTAVETVVMRTLPQGDFVWARTDDGSTAPIIAATLAHGGLVTFGAMAAPERALPSTGSTSSTARQPFRDSHDLDVLTASF